MRKIVIEGIPNRSCYKCPFRDYQKFKEHEDNFCMIFREYINLSLKPIKACRDAEVKQTFSS